MPIYEYVCGKCGEEFEKLVPHSGTEVVCGKCGSKDVQKKMSAFAAGTPKKKACASMGECPSAHSGCAHGGHCCCGHHS